MHTLDKMRLDAENAHQAQLILSPKHCFVVIREDCYLIYREVEGRRSVFVSRCKTSKGLLQKAKKV